MMKKMYLFTQILCGFWLITGCGKKVTDQSDKKKRTESLDSKETISILASLSKDDESEIGKKKFTGRAYITIPAELEVKAGNAGNQQSVVYFNKLGENYAFYCVYQGGANSISPNDSGEIKKGLFYQFIECYNEEGLMNFEPSEKFLIEEDYSVEIEILGADPRFDLSIDGSFEVEWI